ncbi:MAG: FAD-binding oxidoreductase [Candidatus Margulisiibacteriota bacterium]
MLNKTDPSIIQSYLEDSSNLTGGSSDELVIPENDQEISKFFSDCNSNNVPITMHGGGTGTTGGSIPFGGKILSTEKLNKIINVDKAGMFAVVEPGATLAEIELAVKKVGLLYPPDPTEKNATIGGNVATNASGGRCFRFGSTRDWIRRLKIILPNGNILNLKRKLITLDRKNQFDLPFANITMPSYKMPSIKNSAGYFNAPGMDFLDLFIGSEGTLCLISEIELALRPALAETFDLVTFFPAEKNAVDFVLESKRQKDGLINFYEFFDENTLQMLKKSYPHIPDNAKAAIYVEQEVNESNAKTYLDNWGQLLEKYNASLDNCWLGTDAKQKEDLSKFRHAIPEHINEMFKQYHQVKLATDIAVPEDKFIEIFNFYVSELRTHDSQLYSIKFGHIGDNHLHVNLIAKKEEDLPLAKELIMRFVKKAVELGGTVSAEHGIGKIKHQYLKEMYGENGIKEMINVKKVFDPNLILGRNNIFTV